ncbi:MAG: hypothetical protein ACE5L7_03030 [Candidatus Aminicenantales bacterium]
MKISSLTLLVTDDCNFNCSYCYKPKRHIHMDYSTAEKVLVFFCRISPGIIS